jgi:hypothetical protein
MSKKQRRELDRKISDTMAIEAGRPFFAGQITKAEFVRRCDEIRSRMRKEAGIEN